MKTQYKQNNSLNLKVWAKNKTTTSDWIPIYLLNEQCYKLSDCKVKVAIIGPLLYLIDQNIGFCFLTFLYFITCVILN